ncbi:MAG: sugar O-acetyltransferase [Oscillospiraceae bacterium]|jgi:galactoside O-acetyltransferase|nr:sugar O-acetyltransferase [Oscillospiraceae bacterium]
MGTDTNEILRQMHSGEVYDPMDKKLMRRQLRCQDKLRRFNKTHCTSLGLNIRSRMLKQMFAEVGKNCYVEPPLYANWGGRHVHFGDSVYANYGLTLVDDTHIYIGSRTLIGPNVTIVAGTHPIEPKLREKGLSYNLPVHIGKNAWIGGGAVILPGVTVGDNSVIGAGSVVTKDIPPNVVAVGNPCRVLREIAEKGEG